MEIYKKFFAGCFDIFAFFKKPISLFSKIQFLSGSDALYITCPDTKKIKYNGRYG